MLQSQTYIGGQKRCSRCILFTEEAGGRNCFRHQITLCLLHKLKFSRRYST